MEKLDKWIANNVKQLDNNSTKLCQIKGCADIATHEIHRETDIDFRVCRGHLGTFKNKIKRTGDLYD